MVTTKKTIGKKTDQKKPSLAQTTNSHVATQVLSSSVQSPTPTQGDPETAEKSPAVPMKLLAMNSSLDNLTESASAELQPSVISNQPFAQDHPRDITPSARFDPPSENDDPQADEGIRRTVNLLKGQLPADVESAIILVAFIEGHQCKAFDAQQRLADRALQAQLSQHKEANQSKANDIKIKVELLRNSRPIIIKEIDRLKTQREKLLKELDVINTTLAMEENKLENLPATINVAVNDHVARVHAVYTLLDKLPCSLGPKR
ncbi:hypothetical protein C2845_PM03G32960 [Panicum miliaceum]|uniref:Uncharacterized protein n=1 Tax=Panicum miliaceum TaxID=4540 RepID=A0A3L6TAJ7_PANMI|nr:hypothetical protein C2845_PM03G32960 [Panicum miliaceum]